MVAYFEFSEQTSTMVSLAAVMDGDRVVASGGFLVQLLAEAKDRTASLAVMSLRVEDFVDIRDRLVAEDASPDYFIDEVFFGMPSTRLGDSEITAGCNCSETRVFTSLATLSGPEIAELVASDEPIETTCEWCGTTYSIAPERLRGLLVSS
jgi:molecular chaperone Hsp33